MQAVLLWLQPNRHAAGKHARCKGGQVAVARQQQRLPWPDGSHDCCVDADAAAVDEQPGVVCPKSLCSQLLRLGNDARWRGQVVKACMGGVPSVVSAALPTMCADRRKQHMHNMLLG